MPMRTVVGCVGRFQVDAAACVGMGISPSSDILRPPQSAAAIAATNGCTMTGHALELGCLSCVRTFAADFIKTNKNLHFFVENAGLFPMGVSHLRPTVALPRTHSSSRPISFGMTAFQRVL
jgi:hypothetical protein